MEAGRARIWAIMPAAGRSRRMGAVKQFMDIGGRPMLLAALEPLASAAVEGVALITHPAVAAAVGDRLPQGVFLVINDDPASEMIDSVRVGLTAWAERAAIAEGDGVLVCPADQPGIATSDFDRCIEAFRDAPDRIIVATHVGQRGHPIIFPAALAEFVGSRACESGLRELPQAHPEKVRLVACASPAVARDIDTPDDRQGWAE